jgi:urease accessory protein
VLNAIKQTLPMLLANKLMPQGRGLASVLVKRAATVELNWDVRQKSRFDTVDSQGRELGVFLPRGTLVRGGDVLVAEDGSLVRVIAAPQPVLVITHCTEHGTPFDLTRAAYHLGNRHVQIELRADHLKIEPDHVLADMLRAMHLIVHEANAPFEPEGGAYSSHGHAAHAHSHDHAHSHAPAASGQGFRPYAPEHFAEPEHDHGHDHSHSHGHHGHHESGHRH